VIDSHCHLDCDAFDGDRGLVLERAARAGVSDIVVPAVGVETWNPVRALVSTGGPRCHAVLGLHPVSLPGTAAADDASHLEQLAAELSRGGVVGVGECGLDATIDLERAPWERQEAVLVAQVDLARRLDLPVVLHARGPEAYARLLALIDGRALRGVLHSYGGGAERVAPFMACGLYLGFAGPATYANARKVRAAIAAVPAERLLAETDAPDQTPEPHRPGRSEPAYVADIVRGLAQARGATTDEVARLTEANARQLFAI
jgi:TatD DNase family protein